jgi:hypothetical protein
MRIHGKRKEEGIPLLVYGREGEKVVGDWWKRWKPRSESGGERYFLLR